ncbi:conserved hypothetical protein [delta proteobacterium NaphS2]|nr:conserved hypothetical protein [delta proteobacterium NaphS2]
MKKGRRQRLLRQAYRVFFDWHLTVFWGGGVVLGSGFQGGLFH